MSAQSDRLKRRLAAIPKAAKTAVQPALIKAADQMADTMRQLAPDDPATSAPDLKSSIAVTPAGQSTPPYSQPGGSMVVAENAVAITVGDTKVRYPHLLEYGTRKAAAQPFFWPAYRLHRKRAASAIKRAIAKAVRSTKS